jgi:FMN reductase
MVVGIGGSTRLESTTDRCLLAVLRAAERNGAETRVFGGSFVAALPHYEPNGAVSAAAVSELVESVREADGIVIASPGYHGGISGVVKNALDFLEALRDDDRPYLDGRAVGCVATAFGWQACASTLHALRAVVHALRGWPTPLGVMVNTAETTIDADGSCSDARSALALTTVARQVLDFGKP